MTLISTIIFDAYRLGNLTAIGVDPTAAQKTEALRLLNRTISAIFSDDMGEPLSTVALGRGSEITTPDQIPLFVDDILSYYVPPNTRMNCNLTADTIVNLPPEPQPGARIGVIDQNGTFASNNLTLVGNGRTIETATNITLNTSDLAREWFYRDDLGDWLRLSTLAEDDESPFPEAFDDMLIVGLALRLFPNTGNALSQETISVYKNVKSNFKSTYRQTREASSEPALLRLPSNRRTYQQFGNNNTFNRGLL